MTTEVHQVVTAALSKSQLNILRTLQNKAYTTPAYATVSVSAAQHAAMQAAWIVAKASGLPIDPAVVKAAASLGLK